MNLVLIKQQHINTIKEITKSNPNLRSGKL